MSTPEVSVVMPVRNGERWLSAACRSVLGQTLRNLELIIIDDGSTDATPGLLEDLRSSDRRIVVERQGARGLVDALNRGIALARAPLIARLDADDIALPERLARQTALLSQNPDVVLVGTWTDKIDADGRPLGRLRMETNPERLAAILKLRNPFVHSSVMMRADRVRAAGSYRTVCEAAEDYDLWLRLSEYGCVTNIADVLTVYRQHSEGVTQRRAMRQCFSTRLARRAAASRRHSGIDPLAGHTHPPDWWAADAVESIYAADARLFRLLDLAGLETIDGARRASVELPTLRDVGELSHVEKLLLRRAVISLLATPGRPRHLRTHKLAWLWLASHAGIILRA